MLNFILAWIVALIGVKIYLTVKKVDIGFNNDIIAIFLSLIIVTFLNLIQWIFNFVLNIFIK
jgi:hypothetical protein